MAAPPIFEGKSHAESHALAETSGKLLVVDATASWCQPCKAMDRTTWVDPKVVAWLAAHAIAVQIDVDEQTELAASLGIRAMPTVIAFRAGKELDRVVGMTAPRELLGWLEAVERGETAVDQVRRDAEAAPHDMQRRCALARALGHARRHAEATDEYVWLWSHMLEHQPAMVGVRSSFMLSEIAALVEEHAPARARFAALRSAIDVGPPANPSADDVSDWISLSHALGEDERVLEWADARRAFLDARPDLESTLRIRLVPLLIERGRWADVATHYRDPLAALRESHRRTEEVRALPCAPGMEAMRPKMIESIEQMFRRDAGQLVAALLSAGRQIEARAVLDETRALCPGQEMEAALQGAARKAGVDLP